MNNMQKLNIPNPEAHDMGDMFGIPQGRLDDISIGLDAMVKTMNTGELKMVYASDVFRYIENLCQTHEELIWAISNHIQWMFRTGRMASTMQTQQEMINKYGQPKHINE